MNRTNFANNAENHLATVKPQNDGEKIRRKWTGTRLHHFLLIRKCIVVLTCSRLGPMFVYKNILHEILIEFLQKVIQKCTKHFGKD